MALIRIEHDDFVLQVSCGAYDALYAEAKRNITEDALWASYVCSDQVEPQFFSADDAEGVPLDKRAFFFDNSGAEMKYLACFSEETGLDLHLPDNELPTWFRNFQKTISH